MHRLRTMPITFRLNKFMYLKFNLFCTHFLFFSHSLFVQSVRTDFGVRLFYLIRRCAGASLREIKCLTSLEIIHAKGGSCKRKMCVDIMGMAIMIERGEATADGAGRRDFSHPLYIYWNSLDFSHRDFLVDALSCHRISSSFFTISRTITLMTAYFVFMTL